MSRAPRRLLPGTAIEPVEVFLDTHENLDDVVQALREEAARRDRTIDELSRMATQFQIDNARLNRGRKRNGRAPDMATEAFSALVTVLLRHGVAEQQLLEHLADAYRLYKVPRPLDRAKETLALAKQRLAE